MMRHALEWRCSATSSGAAASPRIRTSSEERFASTVSYSKSSASPRHAIEACSARSAARVCGFHVPPSLCSRRRQPTMSPRARQRFFVFGRLAAGRTIAEASAEMGTIAAQLDRAYPAAVSGPAAASSDRQWSAKSVAGFSVEDNGLRRFGMTLVALVGLVLLVACTNLANLVLARGTARQGELAVRMAMGASRARLIWEQCIESVLLAVAGALASYVMFQAVSAFMTTDFVLGLPFGGSATFSIRPAVNAQAVTVAVVAIAARARCLRSRAGGAAGADARHSQRARRRRHRHPAARRPSADGDPLAGRHRRRVLHRRDHVHPHRRSTRRGTIQASTWIGSRSRY